MPNLQIIINNKVATYVKRGGSIICGNSDYVIEFAFDQEWDAYESKVARFTWGGKYVDLPFTGNTCQVPVLRDTDVLLVGVYAGDLTTTTRAGIPCQRSILCATDLPRDDEEPLYISAALEAAEEAKQAAEDAQKAAEEAKAAAEEAKDTAGTGADTSDLTADTLVPTHTWEAGGVSSSGSLTTSPTMMRTTLTELSTLGRLSAYATERSVQASIAEYDANKKFIRKRSASYPGIVYANSDCVFYRLVVYSTAYEQAELPSYIAAEYNGATLPQLFRAVEADRIKTHYAFSHIPIKSINHRGHYTAPENTLPAYRLSAQNGFPFVECDVSLTSDGVPVLLHDETINRTARNADGTELTQEINIGSITHAELAQYDFGIWKGAQYAGTPIPTFEEFIVLCKRLGLYPYIELKSPTNNPFTAETAATIVNIVKKYGMDRSVTYISFVTETLAMITAIDKTARVGYTTASTFADFNAGMLARSGIDTGVNEVFIDREASKVSEDLFILCQAYGWGVEVYGLNTEETVLAVDPRVSGVTSDKIVAADVIRAANRGAEGTGLTD